MNDEMFDLNYFDLKTLVLELISLVAALYVVMSSGICPSGCWWVTPLPQLRISDTSLWVRFSRISTDYSVVNVTRSAACPAYGTNSLLTVLLVLVEEN